MVMKTHFIRHGGRNGLPGTLRSLCSSTTQLSSVVSTSNGASEQRPLPVSRLAPAVTPTGDPARDRKSGEKALVKGRYTARRTMRKIQDGIGSVVEDRWLPDLIFANPPRPSDITLELLMANQTHMGHATALWNPENSRYIMGVRQGIHIISLEATAHHLRRAARVVEEIAYRGGVILFAGTRKGHSQVVSVAADLAGACRIWNRWTPGLITNRNVLLRSNLVRVVDENDQEIPGFEQYGQVPRPLAPDLVICLNPLENGPLLHECALSNIPTIGVIDTDADPTKVTYVIPANDDSIRSVGVITGVLGRAGQEGNRRRLADAKKGTVAWKTDYFMQRTVSQTQSRVKRVVASAGSDSKGSWTRDEQAQITQMYQDQDFRQSKRKMTDFLDSLGSRFDDRYLEQLGAKQIVEGDEEPASSGEQRAQTLQDTGPDLEEQVDVLEKEQNTDIAASRPIPPPSEPDSEPVKHPDAQAVTSPVASEPEESALDARKPHSLEDTEAAQNVADEQKGRASPEQVVAGLETAEPVPTRSPSGTKDLIRMELQLAEKLAAEAKDMVEAEARKRGEQEAAGHDESNRKKDD